MEATGTWPEGTAVMWPLYAPLQWDYDNMARRHSSDGATVCTAIIIIIIIIIKLESAVQGRQRVRTLYQSEDPNSTQPTHGRKKKIK